MNYVRGEGSPFAKLMIVGEAPGKEEDSIGRPFVGPSGDILDELLRDAGVSRSEIWITNVVKYRPPMNDLKRLGEIGLDLKKCEEELWQEIREVNPNVLVPLGNTALKAIAGKYKIQNWRGSIIQAIDRKTKVVPTIHPAALLYSQGEGEGGAVNYSAKIYMLHDIRRAVEQSGFPDYRPPFRRLEVLRSAVEVARFFELYEKSPVLSVDIEVIGCIPVCVGLAFSPNHGVSIPLLDVFSIQNQTGIHPQELAQIWQILAHHFARTDIKVVGQNFKFDQDKLERPIGFRIGNFKADAMLIHHTLYPEFPKSLAFMASIHSEEPYWKDEGKEFNWNKDKIDHLLLYNAKDAAVTLEIVLALIKEGREVEVPGFPNWFDNFYFGFVHRLHKFYMDMERVGLPVNFAKQKYLIETYKAKIEVAQKELNELVGWEINCNSPKQLKALLFAEMRFPNRGSTDEDTLVALMGNHCKGDSRKLRVLELILHIRRLRKSVGTYFSALADGDGRMRTSYRITGTETGRTSTSLLGPPVRPSVTIREGKKKKQKSLGLAFQTMTKHGDVGAELREMFEAPDGYVFVEIDQSQAEARVVALLGRDEATLSMFGRVDIHKLTASWVFGIPVEGVSKELRFIGKTTRHAGNYGMRKRRLMFLVNSDAKKFGIDVQISEWKAGEILKKFHGHNPAIEDVFQKEVEQALYDHNMTLVNPFGRRRQFMGRMNDELLREAYAYIPQSSVGDQTKKAGLEITDALPEASEWFCLEAHDALIALLPENRLRDYFSVAVPAFERPIPFDLCTLSRHSLVIPCEAKVGRNYKDLKDYDISEYRDGTLARASA
jgi:uracil-DNA glycosylase